MAKYRVVLETKCYVTVELEADTKEDAIEKAVDECYVSSFAGNGGYSKLIGVTDSDEATLTIEANDYFEVQEEDVELIE